MPEGFGFFFSCDFPIINNILSKLWESYRKGRVSTAAQEHQNFWGPLLCWIEFLFLILELSLISRNSVWVNCFINFIKVEVSKWLILKISQILVCWCVYLWIPDMWSGTSQKDNCSFWNLLFLYPWSSLVVVVSSSQSLT